MTKVNRIKLLPWVVLSLVLCTTTSAEAATKNNLTITPSEMKWKPSARVPGLETVDIIGSGAGNHPGPYTYRVKLPANFKVQAHSHPDERQYTIISGTWYIDIGEKYNMTKMQALPPGIFYVESANVPHFVATQNEAVVLQVSGTGPTAVNYVDPAHAPPKK
jgi:uncharacterized RmlC-like cupin family protein